MIPIVIGAMFGIIVAQVLVIRRLSKRCTEVLASLHGANDSNEQLLAMLRRSKAQRSPLWDDALAWTLEEHDETLRLLGEYRDEDARPSDDR